VRQREEKLDSEDWRESFCASCEVREGLAIGKEEEGGERERTKAATMGASIRRFSSASAHGVSLSLSTKGRR
jgi:hypothetical protein